MEVRGTEVMRKWTEHCGVTQLVDIGVNAQGKFTGFVPLSYHYAVSWVEPLDELPPGMFFDTVEEAIDGVLKQLRERMKNHELILSYLKRQVSDMEQEHIPAIQKRIDEYVAMQQGKK